MTDDRGSVEEGATAAGAWRADPESAARLRRIAESNMLGMFFWRAGEITDANDELLRIVGHSREDLRAKKLDWIAMTPAEHRDRDQRGLEEMRRRGACTPYEKEYIAKDGERVPVMVGGASLDERAETGVSFVVSMEDSKRSEAARRVAEARLAMIVDSAPLVLWSIDKDGIFTLAEGRGLAALGIMRGRLVGQSVFECLDQVPVAAASVHLGLAGQVCTETVEVGGRVFETRTSPMRGADDAVVGVLGVSMDVTERRRAEERQEKLQAQLLQVQKLESLGVLAGGIAHDFNNLLTGVLGAASAAMLALPEGSPVRFDLDNVISSARQAADLTRQLLAYSGKGHFDTKPLDLSATIRGLAPLLERSLSRKVQLRLELAADLPTVEADVAQVQQILMNLVVNGAEAIGDDRGTVLVTTGQQVIDAVYASSLLVADDIAPGRYVFLEVHDTGCGMDEGTKAKIFDPFFTTKFAGRGLGLPATLGVVRTHKGAMKVHTSPGRGTTMKVFFPVSEKRPTTQSPEPGEMWKGAGVALVIDDDKGVRNALRSLLRFFGFEVIEGVNGRHGLEVFEEHVDEVVVVLLDMTMPELGGEETFRELRRIRPDLPVILSSGYSEVEATRRFTAKGLAGFLQKPFTSDELAERLSVALAHDPRMFAGGAKGGESA